MPSQSGVAARLRPQPPQASNMQNFAQQNTSQTEWRSSRMALGSGLTKQSTGSGLWRMSNWRSLMRTALRALNMPRSSLRLATSTRAWPLKSRTWRLVSPSKTARAGNSQPLSKILRCWKKSSRSRNIDPPSMRDSLTHASWSWRQWSSQISHSSGWRKSCCYTKSEISRYNRAAWNWGWKWWNLSFNDWPQTKYMQCRCWTPPNCPQDHLVSVALLNRHLAYSASVAPSNHPLAHLEPWLLGRVI